VVGGRPLRLAVWQRRAGARDHWYSGEAFAGGYGASSFTEDVGEVEVVACDGEVCFFGQCGPSGARGWVEASPTNRGVSPAVSVERLVIGRRVFRPSFWEDYQALAVARVESVRAQVAVGVGSEILEDRWWDGSHRSILGWLCVKGSCVASQSIACCQQSVSGVMESVGFCWAVGGVVILQRA